MKFLRNVILLAVTVAAIAACDTTKIEDAIDNFGVVIGLEPINTSVSILITDATTGELINTQIETEFSGENGSDVIDIYSDPLPAVDVDGGILNFGISNDVVPTQNQPVTVSLRMSAAGYLSATRTVELFNTGENSYSVSLVSRNNAPTGVEVKDETAGSTDGSGVTTNDVNVDVNSRSSQTNEETGVIVSIPSGSVFLAEDGTPLTGTLRTEAIFYNADEPEAVNAVPSELLVNEGDSAVTMLGAAELTIRDSSGKQATSVQTSASKATATVTNTGDYIVGFILNSTTYTELQQLLRLAYISPTTAERFILYSVPEVTQLNDGRVELRYLLNTNVFKSLALVYFTEQPCNSSLTIERNGNEGQLTVEITEKGFYRKSDIQANSNSISLRNITRGTKTITIKLPYTTVVQELDFCNTSNPTISLPSPPTTLIDATVQVNVSCFNTDEKVRVTDIPAASVVYREEGAPQGTPWRVATDLKWDYDASIQALTGASCKISGVEVGKSYVLKISYDNNVEETTVDVTGALIEYNEVIDEDICN